MIRARVALLGTGKPGDSFRAALPSYQTVAVDEAARTITVDIPNDDYPELPEGTTETVTSIKDQGRVVTALGGATADDTAAYYDEKYQEHAGKFRLDIK